MRKKLLAVVVCALALVMTLAGCGGDKYKVFNKAIENYTVDIIVSYDYSKTQTVNNNIVYSKATQLMNLGGEMTRIVTEKKLRPFDGSGEKYTTNIAKDYYKDGKHGVDTAGGVIEWQDAARDSVFEIKTINGVLDAKQFNAPIVTNNYGINTVEANVKNDHIATFLGENSNATNLSIRLEVKDRRLTKYRLQYDLTDGARVTKTVIEYKINY